MVQSAVDQRYRVQTRGLGERGWRTQAVITDRDAAMREATRVKELETWGRFRQYAYVRVMQGDNIVMAWLHGRPVAPARTREMGGAA